jgi:plastocyanin
VFAYEDEIPEDAEYWASGGFDSQSAAETGWNEEKKGAVRSGQSYVHTFETTGTHGYYCLPHEAAGMVGEVVVE